MSSAQRPEHGQDGVAARRPIRRCGAWSAALKRTLERLFSLTRDKLMKIPAFAWAYTKFRQARAWIEATEAWRTMRSLSKAARDYLTHVRAMRGHRFVNAKDRR